VQTNQVTAPAASGISGPGAIVGSGWTSFTVFLWRHLVNEFHVHASSFGSYAWRLIIIIIIIIIIVD